MKRTNETHLTPLQLLGKNRLTLAGLIVVAVLILGGVFAGPLTAFDPNNVDLSLKLLPPSAEHWFGTDAYGRDIFTRVLYGARATLLYSAAAVGISVLIGVPLGGIAGYGGGLAGQAIMRVMDALSAFPALILAICISTIIGRGSLSAVIAIGVIGVPDYARLMYAQTLSLKERGFVEAERAMGASNASILFRHILPNCVSTLIVRMTIGLGGAIMVIAALSFLGLGVQPPQAEWGSMISDGRSYIMSGQWWIVAFPGLAIALASLSFNLVGDGLRDILDPKAKTGSI